MATRFTIDTRSDGGEISPLWFGHNLEHTRSCVWQGLAAQLLANRKFAGLPQRDGVAGHWHPIGSGPCYFLLEGAGGYGGTDAEPYTARFADGPQPAGQHQRVESFAPGARCGIGQRGIPLVAGRRYEGRLALRADRRLAVRIAVAGALETTAAVPRGPWTEVPFAFQAPATGEAALEITFEGPGTLRVGMASLLPADHFLGMRLDVVARLKEIGTRLLRWPGGNFAGDYRWRDGLLPADRRVPLPSPLYTQPHTDGFDHHEIGTDEFLALCRELGAEPFITLNLGLEGPADAAAWVEYCNGAPDTPWGRRRAERGHTEPYRVRHWTLGNEMGYDHMQGPKTTAALHDLGSACARAMRAVDPGVILTASSGWHRDWYEAIVNPAEDYFENLSHHIYDYVPKVFTGPEGCEAFRRLMAMPAAAFHDTGLVDGRQDGRRLTLRDIRGLIDARPAGRRPIGIAFDEWNVWYAWYRRPGVTEGVHAALMLNHLCREGRRVGVTIGAYFEPVNEGAILVDAAAARLTPVGQVMALFTPHHGARLLQIDPPKTKDVDVAASLCDGGRRLTVTVVNASPDEPRDVEIALAGAASARPEGAVLLESDDFVPGSEFRQAPLDVGRASGSAISIALPPHSVARVMLEVE